MTPDPAEELHAPIYVSWMAISVEVDGRWERKRYLLLAENHYRALLMNGHVTCVPTIEMIERWKIPEEVYEVLIPRTWVQAMGPAADWCDAPEAVRVVSTCGLLFSLRFIIF